MDSLDDSDGLMPLVPHIAKAVVSRRNKAKQSGTAVLTMPQCYAGGNSQSVEVPKCIQLKARSFEHVFEPTTVVGSFNSLSSTGSRNGNFLAGGLEHEWIMTFPSYWDILGMSSSQLTLTPSFFREVGSTTNQFLL